MSVVPISTSPITLPSDSLYPPGEYTGNLGSDTQKSIYQTMLDQGRSAIFQNPVSDAISGLKTNLSSLYNTVNNSGCFTVGEKNSILSAIDDPGGVTGLTQQIELFRIHTEILSGVLAQGTNATPGLDRILSVGKSLGNLAYAIDGAKDCFSLLNNMTGLFSNDLLNGYSSMLSNMISNINGCLMSAIDIISRINEIKNTLANIISADNNFFQNALEQLRQAALASLLESMYRNPCGKLILESKIGQNKLLNYLR